MTRKRQIYLFQIDCRLPACTTSDATNFLASFLVLRQLVLSQEGGALLQYQKTSSYEAAITENPWIEIASPQKNGLALIQKSNWFNLLDSIRLHISDNRRKHRHANRDAIRHLLLNN